MNWCKLVSNSNFNQRISTLKFTGLGLLTSFEGIFTKLGTSRDVGALIRCESIVFSDLTGGAVSDSIISHCFLGGSNIFNISLDRLIISPTRSFAYGFPHDKGLG